MTGAVTTFPLPYPTSGPTSVSVGPDSALWFVEQSVAKIGRVTPAGQISEFSLPSAHSQPVALTSGSDGAVWFTELVSDCGGCLASKPVIARITPAGSISEFSLPPADTGPQSVGGITRGPDGALWFTEGSAHQIGQMTPAGSLREFPLAEGVFLDAITSGSDGALWFTLDGHLGRIMPTTGVVTEYPLPTAYVGANTVGHTGITRGPDGAIWFTWGGSRDNGIGRVTPSGAMTEYLADLSGPLAIGPDSRLWVGGGGQVGRITL
jgi:virginiamycin B lyase